MELIEAARFDELCQALGTEQVLMLVNLLQGSYEEERTRLIEAANNKDIETIHRSAHAIKGMAKNMAAGKLADEALALESYDSDLGPAFQTKIEMFDRLVGETVAAMEEMLAN